MCSTNTKTPSAFNPGYRRPTAAVVGTIEAPRGHDIGPSHTAQMTALNNKIQSERTTHGALEGHMKLQEKQKECLCLKIQRLDRQLDRTRQEHDIQLLKQYVDQQEMQVKHAEDQLFKRHGIEYRHTSANARGKRRVVEVDTPERGRSPSPPKAPRRPSNYNDKFEVSSSASKSSGQSSLQTPEPDMVELSDDTTTEDEL